MTRDKLSSDAVDRAHQAQAPDADAFSREQSSPWTPVLCGILGLFSALTCFPVGIVLALLGWSTGDRLLALTADRPELAAKRGLILGGKIVCIVGGALSVVAAFVMGGFCITNLLPTR